MHLKFAKHALLEGFAWFVGGRVQNVKQLGGLVLLVGPPHGPGPQKPPCCGRCAGVVGVQQLLVPSEEFSSLLGLMRDSSQ